MMYRHFLCVLVFLQLSVQAWAAGQQNDYLKLDNITWADSRDLENDPFLTLRNTQKGLGDENIQLEESKPSIAVINREQIFDHCSPCFLLNAEEECASIQWQISSDQHFSVIQCQSIQAFDEKIELSLLSNTFINPGTDYYFRVRGEHGGKWSAWSKPFCFCVIKPQSVQAPVVERIDEGSVELNWRASYQEDATYLVFGSDNLDFIPSIYLESAFAKNYNEDNLIGQTDVSSMRLENPKLYYRIVAYSKGQYSVPSPIIRIQAETPASVLTKELLQQKGFIAKDYTCSPYVDYEVWASIYPYLLPEYLPVKAVLDQIFSSNRVLLGETSLKKAGFKILSKSKFSKTIVAKHSKLKGYLVKLFTDKQNIMDWSRFKKRILGALQTKAYVDSHGYGNCWKCPENGYILCLRSLLLPCSTIGKILSLWWKICTLGSTENKAKWRSPAVTQDLLIALCKTLHANGLWDSALPKNIPFSEDGKIAPLDTECYNDGRTISAI